MTRDEIQEMADAYLKAALWTADEDIVEPRSGPFDASPYLPRLSDETRAQALKDCTRFFEDNQADLADYPADDAGHDFWLTRNHHGVGFWEADHCTEEEGERLTASAQTYTEKNIVEGDDGTLYLE